MRKIDRDIDLILARLRHLIRERGYTQMEVQDNLGWGRSYISQLLTRQKSLRFEQVLLILNVVDVKPEIFFADVYQLGETHRPRRRAGHGAPPTVADSDASPPRAELRRLKLMADGLVYLLTKKGLITAADLAAAIEKTKREP